MQKRHRIFIAINLPAEVKTYLGGFEQKYLELPARWVKPENLHITLEFLGNLFDEDLAQVCLAAKSAVKNHPAFDITLDGVDYGPLGKLPTRMMWATGPKSAELSALKNDLQNALSGVVHIAPQTKAFLPHVTLARISSFAWRQINPEERPDLPQPLEIRFTAESVEVMESQMGKGGPRHIVVDSYSLL